MLEVPTDGLIKHAVSQLSTGNFGIFLTNLQLKLAWWLAGNSKVEGHGFKTLEHQNISFLSKSQDEKGMTLSQKRQEGAVWVVREL